MGWTPVQVKISKSVSRCWIRFKGLPANRLNKRVFNWCETNGNSRCKNWYFKFKSHLATLNLEFVLDQNPIYSKRFILERVQENEFDVFKRNWADELNKINRPNGPTVN